jgi:arginine/lysine/histidine transport system permease protein
VGNHCPNFLTGGFKLNFSLISDYRFFFIEGVKNTVLISLGGVFFGVILGLFLALMKLSKKKPLKVISSGYIDLIRGTPILIQIWIAYVLLDTTPFTAGLMALSINSSAYVAEIIRSGIESIEKGQMEAARSLGMSHIMAMKLIILPQAVKNIIPVLGNEFIAILKESSIVSVLGVSELMYNVNRIRGNTSDALTPLMVAFVLYFALTSILSKLVKGMERRLKVSDTGK